MDMASIKRDELFRPSEDNSDPDREEAHDPDEEYLVQDILAEKQTTDGVRYLVQWVGYDEKYNTWEPRSSFSDPLALINDWDKKRLETATNRKIQFDVHAWEQRQLERARRLEVRPRISSDGSRLGNALNQPDGVSHRRATKNADTNRSKQEERASQTQGESKLKLLQKPIALLGRNSLENFPAGKPLPATIAQPSNVTKVGDSASVDRNKNRPARLKSTSAVGPESSSFDVVHATKPLKALHSNENVCNPVTKQLLWGRNAQLLENCTFIGLPVAEELLLAQTDQIHLAHYVSLSTLEWFFAEGLEFGTIFNIKTSSAESINAMTAYLSAGYASAVGLLEKCSIWIFIGTEPVCKALFKSPQAVDAQQATVFKGILSEPIWRLSVSNSDPVGLNVGTNALFNCLAWRLECEPQNLYKKLLGDTGSRTRFVFYSLGIVHSQTMEWILALQPFGVETLILDSLPVIDAFMDSELLRTKMNVMVHFSLRRKLHLLRGLGSLRAHRANHSFFLYGCGQYSNANCSAVEQLKLHQAGRLPDATSKLADSGGQQVFLGLQTRIFGFGDILQTLYPGPGRVYLLTRGLFLGEIQHFKLCIEYITSHRNGNSKYLLCVTDSLFSLSDVALTEVHTTVLESLWNLRQRRDDRFFLLEVNHLQSIMSPERAILESFAWFQNEACLESRHFTIIGPEDFHALKDGFFDNIQLASHAPKL